MKLKEAVSRAPGKPKKIFYVWNYLEWGGAQIYFFGLIRRIKKSVEITVLLPSKSDKQLVSFLDELDVPYEFFDSYTDNRPATTVGRKIQRHWNKIRSEFLLLRYLDKIDFKDSVLHIELTPWQSVLALLWLCSKVRVFVTFHNSLPPVAHWRFRLWQIKFWIIGRRENFHVFASNREAKSGFKLLVPKAFFDRIEITYTNVNFEEINQALGSITDKSELCRNFNLPDDKFLVFCVGQFIDRKGRWIFLEAAENLLKKDGDVHFVWVSNSKLSRADSDKIKKFEVKDSFTLIDSGRIGKLHVDLFKLLRIADVFVLASFVEGLPISLLEAMALEIPCVSTNINAIPEAVKHLETGLLIKSGDATGLSESIERLKSDKVLRERLASNGRAFVLQNFNEIQVADIAFKAYGKSFTVGNRDK